MAEETRVTSDQTTTDGAPVKVGDRVWRADASGVRLCRMEKHHLGWWWERMSKEIYSTESAALAGAIDRERVALKKAKQQVRRATRAVERLKVRLHKLGSP